MSLESDLETWLRAQAGIAALVGARVHRNVAADETKPYIVFNRSDTKPERTLAGDVGQAVVQIDFDCWAETASGADAVAAALRAVFAQVNADVRRFRRPVSIGTAAIHSAARGSEQDSYGGALREFQRIVSYMLRTDEE